MLHIVSQSLADPTVLQRIAPRDTVLFIRNAVCWLLRDGRNAVLLQDLQRQCQLYALQPDLALRGIASEDLAVGILTVDYAGFVALAEAHPKIVSWC